MSLNGGYAMIKYNSTQEELQIAYRSKKPVLFYDENQKAHWAVIEETATESVDEETQEQITLYEYSYRLIDEASSVVANPTLSGDEATLNGLEVDGTKYKVGGGSEVHLYQHRISLKGRSANFETLPVEVRFDILLSTNTALTYEDVRIWLLNNGYDNDKRILSVQSGRIINVLPNVSWHIIIGLYGDNNYIYFMLQYINGDKIGKTEITFFNENKSCIDVVTQIF